MLNALKEHWPEYLMEAAGLGIFMVSASVFTILLYHPASPALQVLPEEFPRRVLMGLAMGLTAIGIIYSPWGKQSGAHLNPAVTLTFFWLGKVAPWDAVSYIIAQFVGGVGGVALVATAAGKLIAHPSVNYVATLPGEGGTGAAILGEFIIAFILMSVVLGVSNTQKLARFTGLFAGACVAAFITFEAPISGMSMNPARTFGSAVLPHLWDSLWIYFLAPPLGMLAAAGAYLRLKHAVGCAKLHHQNQFRCIFCEYHTARRFAAHLINTPLERGAHQEAVFKPSPPRDPREERDGERRPSCRPEKTRKGNRLPNLAVPFFCLMFLSPFFCLNAAPITFQSSETQTSLLELYTSEGCSSCPPAETWLNRLKESPGLWKDFVPIAFHVDYWNYLGWRDPWSTKAFTDCQHAYARTWRNGSVYTPGFVLNGKEWRTWSRSRSLPTSTAQPGILKVTSTDLKNWDVTFTPTVPSADTYEAHAALLASGLTSDVKAGENKGRRLEHDFIVISLNGCRLKPDGNNIWGSFEFGPANGTPPGAGALAVWITHRGELEVLQATGGWLPSSH